MTEHWQRTVVTGHGDGVSAAEEVLHRRGADAFRMAMRRNNALAGCSRFTAVTEEAFTQIRAEGDGPQRKRDIPRSGRREEEWDW